MVAISVPSDWLFVKIDVNLLGLQVLFNAPRAELAAEAGLLLADFLVGAHAVILLLADYRTHLRIAIKRSAELDLLGLLSHRVNKFLVDRLLHKNSTARGANFALVDKNSEQRAINGGFEIGV